MKINPVYKKELKISVRSVKMAMVIFAFNLLLAFIGLIVFYLTFQGQGYRNIDYSNILSIYLTISVIEIGLVLFIVPAFTAGSISGERERQTLEILLTTKLKPIQIVLGKLASSISTILLLIVSSLPILSIVFAVGGIRLKDLLQLVLMAAVTAIFIGSIGLFFSCLFKKTVLATVFTYGAVIALTLGTLAIVIIVFVIANINMENKYVGTGSYQTVDIGYLLLILLVNPGVTLVSMITGQYGSSVYLKDFIGEFGTIHSVFVNHWFIWSIVSQLLVSVVFIFGAARVLNPLRRRK